MIIRVKDLEPEGFHVEAPLSVGSMRTDAGESIGVRDARFLGDVKRSTRGVDLRGRLTCSADVPCARCLSTFRIEVDRSFHLRYAFAAPSGREIEIPEEDLDVDFLKADGELDLGSVAMEQIYLELPMKPVCREACRGLCPTCGADLNAGSCACAASQPQA